MPRSYLLGNPPELYETQVMTATVTPSAVATHLRARSRAENNQRRRSIFERYIPEIGAAIARHWCLPDVLLSSMAADIVQWKMRAASE